MDRFDEEAANMAKAILYKELTEPICSYFKRKLSKAYAEGQASNIAEVDALKEKVGRIEKVLEYLESHMDSDFNEHWLSMVREALTPPAGEQKEKI